MPYLLVGASAATVAQSIASRLKTPLLRRVAPALALLVAPGCDCSMNGYASAIARAPLPVAGFAMTWAAACSPVSLFATHAILGERLLWARVAGTLVAAVCTSVGWSVLGRSNARACCDHRSSGASSAIDHFGNGALALVPAAAFAGIALTWWPNVLRAHASAATSALLAALLSPCSTADAVLARVLTASAGAQAAFVIAAQLLDARQLALVVRVFGPARAGVAALSAALGCAVAVFVASPR